METAFLLASHQILEESSLLKSTARLRTDGFVFLFPVLLVFLFLLGRKKNNKQPMYLSLTLFANTVLVFIVNYVIKIFIERERPYKALGLPTPEEDLAITDLPVDSFPSDHAAVSMTIAATLLFRGYHTKNKGIKSLGRGFFLIAIIMCRGRIAIAIHRPTDIIAGFTVGIIVAFLTTRVMSQELLIPLWEWCIGLWEKIISHITPNQK